MPMPRKPDPIKYCATCKIQLARLRYPAGSLESIPRFLARKYCSQNCMGLASRELSSAVCPGCRTIFRPKNAEHRYCSQKCYGEANAVRPPEIRAKETGRCQARRQTIRQQCSECGRTVRLHVHHRDENPTNNVPENLQVLCHPCHAKKHRKPTAFCRICGRKAKRFKACGHLCDKHYRRFKKYGDPTLSRPIGSRSSPPAKVQD